MRYFTVLQCQQILVIKIMSFLNKARKVDLLCDDLGIAVPQTSRNIDWIKVDD